MLMLYEHTSTVRMSTIEENRLQMNMPSFFGSMDSRLPMMKHRCRNSHGIGGKETDESVHVIFCSPEITPDLSLVLTSPPIFRKTVSTVYSSLGENR